ncbi:MULTISPECIES: hypothetical protein [unclassified Bradyrhizobium]|nr:MULTISPECIES: hypothetical protein [unclassified Bradyrhizobium]
MTMPTENRYQLAVTRLLTKPLDEKLRDNGRRSTPQIHMRTAS